MTAEKILLLALCLCVVLLKSTPAVAEELDGSMEARGKYLIEIGGCNDCHTGGFAASGGAIPESEWLLGDSLGFRGPWGTTYPLNLREYVAKLSEDQWVNASRVLRTRPPMPWWALNAMTEDDLRAVFRYIKTLDLVKSEIPSYVPPDQTPSTPYIQWPAH